jgi:uncharacterized protein YjbI with pentapeptide repeats
LKAIQRRTLLKQIGVLAGLLKSSDAVAHPFVVHRLRRVSQSELLDAIELHQLWLQADSRGRRAAFPNCDLSGLDFLSDQPDIVNLRGSDFTEADLSGITANQVSFHLASLQHARLSQSNLKLPIFSGATLRRAKCEHALWGWSSASTYAPPPPIDGWKPAATFLSADLSFTTFDGARVLGFFSDVRFNNASLKNTDLSHSEFTGVPTFCDNSFAGSSLEQTKFRHARIEASHFRFAYLIAADFSFARIGSKCTWPTDYEHTKPIGCSPS